MNSTYLTKVSLSSSPIDNERDLKRLKEEIAPVSAGKVGISPEEEKIPVLLEKDRTIGICEKLTKWKEPKLLAFSIFKILLKYQKQFPVNVILDKATIVFIDEIFPIFMI